MRLPTICRFGGPWLHDWDKWSPDSEPLKAYVGLYDRLLHYQRRVCLRCGRTQASLLINTRHR